MHLIAAQQDASIVDRQKPDLVQHRDQVGLAILGQELSDAPIEAASVHDRLAGHGVRLDFQAVHESAFMAAAVDSGKHRIDIYNCMNVQYASWTAKPG